mmetsp:Transcript_17237/g.32901  ORF Transcript_17237/g.32901 Transcript_17237/m.32901 type:complete len:320 (-) Transcript_17237:1256-2215(-)
MDSTAASAARFVVGLKPDTSNVVPVHHPLDGARLLVQVLDRARVPHHHHALSREDEDRRVGGSHAARYPAGLLRQQPVVDVVGPRQRVRDASQQAVLHRVAQHVLPQSCLLVVHSQHAVGQDGARRAATTHHKVPGEGLAHLFDGGGHALDTFGGKLERAAHGGRAQSKDPPQAPLDKSSHPFLLRPLDGIEHHARDSADHPLPQGHGAVQQGGVQSALRARVPLLRRLLVRLLVLVDIGDVAPGGPEGVGRVVQHPKHRADGHQVQLGNHLLDELLLHRLHQQALREFVVADVDGGNVQAHAVQVRERHALAQAHGLR